MALLQIHSNHRYKTCRLSNVLRIKVPLQASSGRWLLRSFLLSVSLTFSIFLSYIKSKHAPILKRQICALGKRLIQGSSLKAKINIVKSFWLLCCPRSQGNYNHYHGHLCFQCCKLWLESHWQNLPIDVTVVALALVSWGGQKEIVPILSSIVLPRSHYHCHWHFSRCQCCKLIHDLKWQNLLWNYQWHQQWLWLSWGRIFSRVWPFYERGVSDLDRSMNISLWV
jgi:hypothetical protein